MPIDELQEDRASVGERLAILHRQDGPDAMAAAASSIRSADIARGLEEIEPEIRRQILAALPDDLAAAVLEEAEPEIRDEFLEESDDRRLLDVLTAAEADDAVYLLDAAGEERAAQLLATMDDDLAAQLGEQFELEDDSCGRMMSRDVVTLRSFMTAQQAIDLIRRRAKTYEGSLYVVDAKGRLVGVLMLRDAVVADHHVSIGSIMDRKPHRVWLDDDRQVAIDLMQRYHLRGIAVVTADGRLMGQITWDDAADALEAEANEDMLALAGTSEDLEENAGVLRRARQRLPYLLLTTVGGFVMAHLIDAHQGSTLAEQPVLIAFLPLVPALGGNIGIQSSTVTVRSIATGELNPGRMLRRTLRELGTGTLLSVVLALTCGLGAMLFFAGGDLMVGGIVVISLLIAVTIAACFGVLIPLACLRTGIDPAIAAGPFITMLNDISGVGLYLVVASMLLAMAGGAG